MRSRLASLRIAATLAAGFIILRVAYRIVFGGAGGNGILVIELPRVRLGGPFSHITLFGDITTGGMGAAALSAVPFAVLILGFGVLAVLVDLRGMLTRGAVRGPVRTVSRVLVVAWGTFPALLASVRRVRVARELRGERSIASLLVPVLEQTVERAIALGASMEVRGFAASGRVEPTGDRPATMRDAALGYAGDWTLRGLDLDLAPGSLTLVTGATGSGKSTLLHSLSGLFQHVFDGDQLGRIEVGGLDRLATPPRETAGFVGAVAQSVRLSFVADTVDGELGFALAMRGDAPEAVAGRCRETASQLGIGHLLDRDIVALSAGEACLVAIGAAIIAQPRLLLVDEPLADLDTAARERVVQVLGSLARESGMCVVVAEHAMREWGSVPDRRLELRGGSVQPAPAARESLPATRRTRPSGPAVARIRHLSVRHGDLTAVDDAGFDLSAGELVALRGANGAGKSSLLHEIARPRLAGTVEVDGADLHALVRSRRHRQVALVPEESDDLLFATTVQRECRRAGGGTAGLFTGFLGYRSAQDAVGIMARHPRDLSAGERLCLVLAIQLSASPSVLLIDEPTRGLDSDARELVARALISVAEAGAAVVFATHDRDFAERFATRTVWMSAGRITTSAEVVS